MNIGSDHANLNLVTVASIYSFVTIFAVFRNCANFAKTNFIVWASNLRTEESSQ